MKPLFLLVLVTAMAQAQSFSPCNPTKMLSELHKTHIIRLVLKQKKSVEFGLLKTDQKGEQVVLCKKKKATTVVDYHVGRKFVITEIDDSFSANQDLLYTSHDKSVAHIKIPANLRYENEYEYEGAYSISMKVQELDEVIGKEVSFECQERSHTEG
jgi:hypothetical protein